MADRVLPNRDYIRVSDVMRMFRDVVGWTPAHTQLGLEVQTPKGEWLQVGEVIESGRLVDREVTIDYEWLCIELNHGIRRISNLPGNEGHCYFTSKPNHLTTCGNFGIVVAVLEDL